MAPLPGPWLKARIEPWCISTIALLIANPRPSPSRRGPICSKASKTLSKCSGSMPTPVSLISIVNACGSGLAVRTVTAPCAGVNFEAFRSTFQKTCCKRAASARTT